MSPGQPLEHASVATLQNARHRPIRRLLYSQNPFYLLSVAFVLHGTGIWYRANAQNHSPWILMGIISAYILMMSVTGFAIVKWGRVWDDARSILLILLALFLELGMTSDDVLIGDRSTGRVMIVVSWLLSAGVSEFILLGLRIRLKLLYRIPYHLLLALIILYPLAIVTGEYPHNTSQNSLTIFLFSLLLAMSMLGLLPAVRRGSNYVKNNGTPWHWPLFPWSLFVFLFTMAVFRSYSLCLSFDPVLDVPWPQALELQNSFGGAYLALPLLAGSVLCLEGHVATGNVAVRRVGLTLPFLAIILASPAGDSGPLYVDLVNQVTSQLASPVWLTAIVSSVILASATVRGIRSGEVAFSSCVVLLAFLNPASTGLHTIDSPPALPLIIAGAVQVWCGCRRQASIKVFAGTLCFIVLIRTLLSSQSGLWQDTISWHLALVAVTAIAFLMRDLFARFLRPVAGIMLVLSIVAGPIAVWRGLYELTTFATILHMVAVSALAAALAWQTRHTAMKLAALVTTSLTGIFLGLKGIEFFLRLPGGKGILWAIGGLLWFSMAVLISVHKAGMPMRIRQLLSSLQKSERH